MRQKATITMKFFSLVLGLLSFVLIFNVYFILLRRFGVNIPAYFETTAVFARDVPSTILVIVLSTIGVIVVFGLVNKLLKYVIKTYGIKKDVDRVDALILLVIFVWLVMPPIISYFVYLALINSIMGLIFVMWFVYPSTIIAVIYFVMFLLEKTEPRVG